jgi:hypothetical protein
MPEDMTIPWIVFGPGVLPGTKLTSPVVVDDTAVTAIWVFGLALPEGLARRPAAEALGGKSLQPGRIEPVTGLAPKVPFPASSLRGRVEGSGLQI